MIKSQVSTNAVPTVSNLFLPGPNGGHGGYHMFCHHHEEAEVYGTEPVPCPFCGLGGPEEAPETQERDPMGFEDSNKALRHAMFDTEAHQNVSRLNVHW